jgi:adenine C2-methylase RlmN of 23S rRNA A2503 and tRNA A37
LVDQVMKQYDLLSAVEYHTYNTKKIEKLWTKIVEYVNLIDVTVVSKKNK